MDVFEIVCRQAAGKEDGWTTANRPFIMGEVLSRNAAADSFTREQAGFYARDKITVKCQQGQLIITKDGTRADSGE